MRYLLILLVTLVFIGNTYAQVGFHKEDFIASKGKIRFINDTVEISVKPSQANSAEGKYASYLGIVTKVNIIRNGYALFTLGSDKKSDDVVMFTNIPPAKAIGYKGRSVVVSGKLRMYKGKPAFYNYKRDTSTIYFAKIANPGCKCQIGEPNTEIVLDTVKSGQRNGPM